MDLRQLEMFLAVAENASFTKAGQHLHVSQSAVSRMVGLLEDELGEKLFKRVRHNRIYVTAAGEALLRHTRRIFQELRLASMEVSELTHLSRGKVRIGAGMTACIYLLPPVLEKFKALYPNIETEVVTGPSEKLITQVRNNHIDLGLFTLPVSFPDLEVRPCCTEEMVVVTGKNHPLARRRKIKVAEIGGYPLILFGKAAITRTLLEQFFQAAGITPQIAMESESVATIKPLVQINLGMSILPLSSVVAEARRGELHYLHIGDYKLTREIGLVFQKTDYLPRLLAELIRLFEKAS